MTIHHPDMLIAICTCEACPEQWEGVILNGVWFYFRYRHGYASLGIGLTRETAISDRGTVGLPLVKEADGVFDDDQQRDTMFATLLKMRMAEFTS